MKYARLIKLIQSIGVIILVAYQSPVMAGFLEMPEITEAPELKRESMLRDLDIPGVQDRDPDPEAGPRLAVSEFRLQGIVEYPELGITRQELSKMVEEIRFDMMDEGKLLESGYTQEELGEVSDLLVDIENETKDRHVGSLEVQKLVWLVREQRSKRGITLGMIETIADKITNFYRERGFILAKAYIPEQEVREGVVTLTLLLGVLGEVSVNENTMYKDKSLSYVFDDLLAKPVTDKAIEEKLFLVNDFPGLNVQGFFEPGSQVGDTRLNINVRSEKRYDFNLRLDNHGSDQTGKNRLYAEAFWHNPIGYADQLQASLLYATDPSNTTYGQLRYSGRLFTPRLRFALGAANNDFVLGPGNSESVDILELEGETNQADVTVSYFLKRSRRVNYILNFSIENTESILRPSGLGGGQAGDVLGLDDELRDISIGFNFDLLQEKARILHQGNIELISGEFQKGVEVGQDKNYSIFKADYSLLTFVKMPFFDANTRVILRSSLQLASSPLSSISQFSLAGPTRTRGFEINQFSADDSLFAGVDWILDGSGYIIGEILQPFLFADVSYGNVQALAGTTQDSDARLVDVGIGAKFSYGGKLRGNLQFAFPVSSDFSSSDIPDPGSDVKVVFDLQYNFR